ncbi:MAG: PEP-CTERM sorting domain-containing protein [Nitrospiraceae bacterium]|nr:PEP-CTERM sorting domain-containing protein [Nitrospiraceae bacterium]
MQDMRKRRECGALVLGIALWWAAPMPVHAAPFTAAVEYATSFFSGVNNPLTLGYQFSMSGPFNVDALASWVDPLNNNNREVGLWDSVGTLLVATTVLNTDPIQGHFQYHSIPTMNLVPGVYTIGGTIGQGTLSDIFPTSPVVGVVTVPGYTYITTVGESSVGLTYPTQNFGSNPGENPFLIANFSVASAVPESSTLILLASGLAGILGYGWRRKGAVPN